jgi:hypothetical protein
MDAVLCVSRWKCTSGQNAKHEQNASGLCGEFRHIRTIFVFAIINDKYLIFKCFYVIKAYFFKVCKYSDYHHIIRTSAEVFQPMPMLYQ